VACTGALLLAAPLGAAPLAFITNQASHDVSVIDLASDTVVATIPVGRAPAGVAACSANGRVYVSNPDSRDISVIEIASRRVLHTWPAGSGPVGIAAAPDCSRLVVADWFNNRLLVYDTVAPAAGPAQPKAVAVGRAPAGVAVPRGAALAYVAERDDDSVAVVDTAALRVLARVRVGSHPFALLHDAPRQRLYALNVQSNDISVIDVRDPAAPRELRRVPVGEGPYGAALAAGGRLLYVTNQLEDSVSVIDAQTLQPLRKLGGFGYPEGIAAHGSKVYVVNWMDDRVSVLDADSSRLLKQVATGRNPRGFGEFIAQAAATRAEPSVPAAPAPPLNPHP
jgi:YVTN family beta-propeller protein